MSKLPVIGSIKTFRDVKSALDNIRNWLASNPTTSTPSGTGTNTVISVGGSSVVGPPGPPGTPGAGFVAAQSVANYGTITLPAIASGFGAKGNIVLGAYEESIDFYIDADGNVSIVHLTTSDVTGIDGGSSSGVPAISSSFVSNANTSGKISVGDSPAVTPVVITNRTGSAVKLTVMVSTI